MKVRLEPSTSWSLWWPLAAITLVRLALAVVVPLFPDEAYYWEWSRHPALGYFDHPPMIGWLVRAGTAVAGDTRLGVRLGAVLCGAVAGIAMVLTARRLGDHTAGRRAVWLAALLPLFFGAFVLATPDAPLLAFGAWALLAGCRAVDERSTGWWLLAGAFVGFALLAKYTAVLLPLGVFATCLWHRPLRGELGRPGPWAAVVVALLVAAPMIWWNATHEWASFRFQFGHGLRTQGDGAVGRLVSYAGGQLLVMSPVLMALFVLAGLQAVVRGARPSQMLLVGSAAFILLFFGAGAFRRLPEANWPALAYPAAAVLLATSPIASESPRAWRSGLAVAGAFTLALVLAASSLLDVLPVRMDPFRNAHGWGTLGDSVVALTERSSGPGGGASHLAADRYQDAAMLEWHVPGHPDVLSLNLAGRANQYDFWPGFADRAAQGDGMVLALAEAPTEPRALGRLREHFASVERGPLVEERWRGTVVRRHRLWLLRGWHGTWPPARGDVPPGRPPR